MAGRRAPRPPRADRTSDPSGEPELVLRTDRDLLRFRRRAARSWIVARRPVSLTVSLDEPRRSASERRLNALISACGCRIAALVFVAVFVRSGATAGLSPPTLPRAVAEALLLAIAAKFITLLVARAMLLGELTRLRRALGRRARSAEGGMA